MPYNHKLVNDAVKIKISLDRKANKKRTELEQALARCTADMTMEEFTEYNKRIK